LPYGKIVAIPTGVLLQIVSRNWDFCYTHCDRKLSQNNHFTVTKRRRLRLYQHRLNS
jgi:hypothetical protein